jgi:hypothetical protein
MAVGLFDAARDAKCPTIYTENTVLVDPYNIYPGDTPSKRLDLNLTVGEYMQAYGLEMVGDKAGKPDPQLVKAAYIILDTLRSPYRNVSNSLNFYTTRYNEYLGFFPAVQDNMECLEGIVKTMPANQQKLSIEQVDELLNQPHIETELKQSLDNCKTLFVENYAREAAKLAEKLRHYGLVEWVQLSEDSYSAEIKLKSLQALRFLHGIWLEYYVYGKLKEKYAPKSAGGIDSRVAQGVEFKWRKTELSDVKNELDVLLTKGTEMTFISCKSGGYYRGGSKGEQREDFNLPIYQLETIAQSAGIFLKKVLVLCQPRDKISKYLKERADVFGIKVIALEELPNIATLI